MAKKRISGVNLTIIIMAVIVGAYIYTGAYNYKEPAKVYPVNPATFRSTDSTVGCTSSYSKEKQNDIFRQNYQDHWMTWGGTIELVGNGKVAINCNDKGTQDLSVTLAEKSDTYNLQKGQHITVKFLMQSRGGCFLPFSGKQGIVQ